MANRDANGFVPEWDTTVSTTNSVFFARNSNLVIFGVSPVKGFAAYGVRGAPAQERKFLIYDPYSGVSSPSDRDVGFYAIPSATWNCIRIMAYSASDLSSVASGSIAYDAVKPKAIYSLPTPFPFISSNGFAFDNSNGRLYLSQRYQTGSAISYDVFSVYSFSKWS